MSKNENKQHWATVRRIDGNCISLAIKLHAEKYSFGRGADCDFNFDGNKYISSRHCYIERDAESGQAWLVDTSTNGTSLNLTNLIQKKVFNHSLLKESYVVGFYCEVDIERYVSFRFEYFI
jgi:hypothetical protein